MEFEKFFAKTPATLDEIKNRVAFALERHPLCRNVQFDVVSMPRSSKGGIGPSACRPSASDALWKASEIIADIQDAYELTAAPDLHLFSASSSGRQIRPPCAAARLGLNSAHLSGN